MEALVNALAVLKGYRTYLAAFAAILSSLATLAGIVDPTHGASISIAMLGIAQVFHRMASADHALTLAEIAQNVQDVVVAVKPAVDDFAQPATIPMKPSA